MVVKGGGWLGPLWLIWPWREKNPPSSQGQSAFVSVVHMETHTTVKGNLSPCSLLSPVTSYYSPLGFAQHEKGYFWAKLNWGVLKIKEQHSCSSLPFWNSFLFLPKVIAPGVTTYWIFKRLFCNNDSQDGLILHCFRSLVSLFLLSIFLFPLHYFSFMFFPPSLYSSSSSFLLSWNLGVWALRDPHSSNPTCYSPR